MSDLDDSSSSSDSSGFSLDSFLRDAGGVYTSVSNAQLAQQTASANNAATLATTQATAAAKVLAAQAAAAAAVPTPTSTILLYVGIGLVAILVLFKVLK